MVKPTTHDEKVLEELERRGITMTLDELRAARAKICERMRKGLIERGFHEAGLWSDERVMNEMGLAFKYGRCSLDD